MELQIQSQPDPKLEVKPPSMTLDKGSLAPRQPGSLVNSRPAEAPAAVFIRTEATLDPNVYTTRTGTIHFDTAKGIVMETNVEQPTPVPPTPLKEIAREL